MRRRIRLCQLVAVCLAHLFSAASAHAGWGDFAQPSPPPSEVIGTYTRGCLAGGEALPLDGAGYHVMRVSRARYFGHPTLVQFVEKLATSLDEQGHPGLLIGDLAQPRGGPMPSGHRSHQIGLDADIWFLAAPGGALTADKRESLPAPTEVGEDGVSVNGGWGPLQVMALRTAALFPEVDRIFVNPAIKRELCQTETDDRGWLRKIRPWWGHDAHFHVRLACPDDQPACVPQPPVAPGDGCDADLAWWFSADAAMEAVRRAKAPPAPPITLDDLPPACRAVYGIE